MNKDQKVGGQLKIGPKTGSADCSVEVELPMLEVSPDAADFHQGMMLLCLQEATRQRHKQNGERT